MAMSKVIVVHDLQGAETIIKDATKIRPNRFIDLLSFKQKNADLIALTHKCLHAFSTI